MQNIQIAYIKSVLDAERHVLLEVIQPLKTRPSGLVQLNREKNLNNLITKYL